MSEGTVVTHLTTQLILWPTRELQLITTMATAAADLDTLEVIDTNQRVMRIICSRLTTWCQAVHITELMLLKPYK